MQAGEQNLKIESAFMNINGFDPSHNKRHEIEDTIARFKDVLDVSVEMNGEMVPYSSYSESSTDPVNALSIMCKFKPFFKGFEILCIYRFLCIFVQGYFFK